MEGRNTSKAEFDQFKNQRKIVKTIKYNTDKYVLLTYVFQYNWGTIYCLKWTEYSILDKVKGVCHSERKFGYLSIASN